MILESIFRLAFSEYKKKGKLPGQVTIYRANKTYTFPKPQYISLAGKIAKIKPSRRKGEQHAAFLVGRAAHAIYAKNLKSPAAGWCLHDVEKASLANAKVLDCRVGYKGGLDGMAYERLCAIFDPSLEQFKTVSRHYCFIDAVRDADVIIVDTPEQSYKLQHYFACRAMAIPVIHTEQLGEYWTGVKEDGFSDKRVVAHG